jgi:hypothetical protein
MAQLRNPSIPTGTPPSDAEWQSQLAGQTRFTVGAADAVAAVREAWARGTAAERGS